MTLYIDQSTGLPENLGEIYSDRNIRISGDVRVNNATTIEISTTTGLSIYCTPIAGGAEVVTTITGGVYTLAVGSSMWAKVNRTTSSTVTPEFYTAGNQPKSRKDYIQLFYRTSTSVVAAASSFLIYQGLLYTRLGYGVGQRVFDAIVNDTSVDPHATHSNLADAITDTPDNGWILIKKVCQVSTTLTTGGKCIKFMFEGCGSGIQANGATTGIQFGKDGCQLVGFGVISGFTTAVDLNSKLNCRLEMVFSGNTNNIGYGSLTSAQVNVQGSYGLTENSTIETSTTHGTLSGWNNTTKRWVAIPALIMDDSGNITLTGSVTTAGSFVSGKTYTIVSVGTTNFTLIGATSNAVGVTFTATGIGSGTGTASLGNITSQTIIAKSSFIGNVPAAGTSLVLTDNTNSTFSVSHPATNIVRAAVNAGQTLQFGDGTDTNVTIDGTGIVTIAAATVSTNSTTGALVVTGGVGIGGALNVAGAMNVASIVSAGTIQGTTITATTSFIGNSALTGTSLTLGPTSSQFTISHPSSNILRAAVGAGQTFQIGDGTDTNMTIDGTGIVTISCTTDSTLATNGALLVSGGVGIAKALNVGTTVSALSGGFIGSTINGGVTLSLTSQGYSTFNISHPAAGVVRLASGANQAWQICDGTDVNVSIDNTGIVTINAVTDSSGTNSGTLVVSGGAGFAKSVYVGGVIITTSTTGSTSTTSGSLQARGGAGIAEKLYVGSDTTVGGTLKTTLTTDSTGVATGALQSAGGAGIAKTLYVGINIVGSGTGSSNITGFKVYGAVYN